MDIIQFDNSSQMHYALQRIRGTKYFVHKLTQMSTRASVWKSAVCLERKVSRLHASAEKPRMSGSHLGIRFEVSAKLAGTRGSKTPNFETSRVTDGRLPM